MTDKLGLKELGVAMDPKGFVKVDAQTFATNVPGIYAIGDVIGGLMLAHKAEEEGIAAAEIMAGKAGHVNYNVVPGVVYNHPELARQEALKALYGRGSVATNVTVTGQDEPSTPICLS